MFIIFLYPVIKYYRYLGHFQYRTINYLLYHVHGWPVVKSIIVVSSPLNCLQVLQPNGQPQSTLNDDQSLVVAHSQPLRPWDIFSNYYPEFKAISRVCLK